MEMFIVIGIFIIILIYYNSILTKKNKKIEKEKEGFNKIILVQNEKISTLEKDKIENIEKIEILTNEVEKLRLQLNQRLNPSEEKIFQLENEISNLQLKKANINNFLANYKLEEEKLNKLILQNEKTEKQYYSQLNKIKKIKELYKSIQYSVEKFPEYQSIVKIISDEDFSIIPNVMLKLHHMDIKSLNKLFKENQKQIETILNQYEDRYTTKTNKTIYHLMVVALQAELQNVLYNLKYEKLEVAIEDIKAITQKYLALAEEGNQTIAKTLITFIGQIEYLFINAVKIEYNYYVKKEQARQEQLAIRQQMREEAEERRLLKLQQEKIEAEESKFHNELDRTEELLKNTTNQEEIEMLNKKILELQAKLSDVAIKKEEIVNLQNGKAGNVYIISNLGSFGENVFKIGMTRRLDPQERINELGSASVPFKFDVHSFIFSEDAVSLEKRLHQELNDKRVNKVNLRKEFFNSTIDELEELVNRIDPTAEFNKTMIAEEYFQSLSSDENYSNDFEDKNEEEIIE